MRRARRRIMWNGFLAQFAFAACVAVASAVLLLVTGTQLLDWRWLALITAVSLGLGIWRAARRVPSPYVAAQVVDRAAGLKDALSTAVYYQAGGRRPVPDRIREAQFAHATALAAGVDLRRAIPFTMPHAAYTLVGLVLVASSLFALRYGVERRMDLKAPLARLLMPWLGLKTEVQAEARNRRDQATDRKKEAERTADAKQDQGQHDPSLQQPLEGIDVPEVDGSKSSATVTSEQRSESAKAGEKSDQMEEVSEESDSAEGAKGENSAAAANGKQDKEASEGKPTTAPAESSLLSKLRDAMSNLMSRMKQQPNAGGTPVPSKNGQQARSGAQQQTKDGQRGSREGQGQKQSGQGGQEAQDGQPGEDAANTQAAQGKTANQGGEDSSRNAASGIGRQDGNKDTRLAEQLAAMGKISEIIGKRSANVTGEITVEVRSSKQQLRTAYTAVDAAHGDRGGEIHRDEVPVAYQHYVQQYFAEVRKQSK